jgi:ribosomal protein S18 acetylase RimI-like enzyme
LKLKLPSRQIIRRIDDSDKEWVQNILSESWGSTKVVTRGTIHHADRLPGFIAESDGQKVGMITWDVNDNMLEIVTLNVLKQREGIGRALIYAVFEEAESLQCTRVWVITTNDNIQAMSFYQSLGLMLVKVHKDAVTESRKLKPEIPLIGIDGIPINYEIELEKILTK